MPPPGDACVAVPAPWSTATMWQYSWTGSVPGIEGPVDRDAFLGSLAGLQALATPAGADAGNEPSRGPSGGPPGAQDREAGAWSGSPGCF
jgi:hypothetical protein